MTVSFLDKSKNLALHRGTKTCDISILLMLLCETLGPNNVKYFSAVERERLEMGSEITVLVELLDMPWHKIKIAAAVLLRGYYSSRRLEF